MIQEEIKWKKQKMIEQIQIMMQKGKINVKFFLIFRKKLYIAN